MANGDIALTTPVSITDLVLSDVTIIIAPQASLTATFFESNATSRTHVVRVTNATNGVIGFDLTAGVFTDGILRSLTGYLTTILGVLFIGDASTLNQRKTAFVTRLKADNVITVNGTVG